MGNALFCGIIFSIGICYLVDFELGGSTGEKGHMK
jgi:hypothetical protein